MLDFKSSWGADLLGSFFSFLDFLSFLSFLCFLDFLDFLCFLELDDELDDEELESRALPSAIANCGGSGGWIILVQLRSCFWE